MYDNCIEFAMELCQPCNQEQKSDMLYWNLALLHKFHLIHMDIKPDNLMLSPTFRKAVFIDFGLSRFIRE